MDVQTQIPATLCATKAGLIAGTTTTLTTSVTVNYGIRGKAYSKTALSNSASPTTDYASAAAFNVIAINKGSVFTIGFDHSGNAKAVQGSIEDLDTSGNFVRAPNFGPIPDDFCPIGYVVCKNGSTGSNWTFGSSNWTATGMTATFVDVMTLPDRPQVS